MKKETLISELRNTIRTLKTSAREKESIRKKLAVTASQKEIARKKLALVATALRTKAKQLAVTTKELARVEAKHEAALVDVAASELRYRKLFETAQDGILLIDPVTEKIIDANPFLLDLLGYSLDEIIGKKIWELRAIKDVEASKESFEELQKVGHTKSEIPLQSKDGKEHQVGFVSNKYKYRVDGSEMIQCNIRDITLQKVAEKLAATNIDELAATNESLEQANKSMVGREIRMVELKGEIEKLKEIIAKK
jgi:PAS domain S-box-containing protein